VFADYTARPNPLFNERKIWNVARVCGRKISKASSPPEFIARTTRGKNSAILTGQDHYGKGLAEETKKRSTRSAFTEKMFESYQQGRTRTFNALDLRMSSRRSTCV